MQEDRVQDSYSVLDISKDNLARVKEKGTLRYKLVNGTGIENIGDAFFKLPNGDFKPTLTGITLLDVVDDEITTRATIEGLHYSTHDALNPRDIGIRTHYDIPPSAKFGDVARVIGFTDINTVDNFSNYAGFMIGTSNITYTLNGGANPTAQSLHYTEADTDGTTHPIQNPSPRYGYIFLGWTATFDLPEMSDHNTTDPAIDYSIPMGAQGDLHLRAHWTKDTTINFQLLYDGTDPTGPAIDKPEKPGADKPEQPGIADNSLNNSNNSDNGAKATATPNNRGDNATTGRDPIGAPPSATPNADGSAQGNDGTDTTTPSETLTDPATTLSSGATSNWSLLSLLLALTSVLVSLMFMLIRRRKDSDDDYETGDTWARDGFVATASPSLRGGNATFVSNEAVPHTTVTEKDGSVGANAYSYSTNGQGRTEWSSEYSGNSTHHRLALKLIAVLVGLLPIALFWILDSITAQMTFINKWTVVVAIAFVAHIVLTVVVKARQDKESENDYDYIGYRTILVGSPPTATLL